MRLPKRPLGLDSAPSCTHVRLPGASCRSGFPQVAHTTIRMIIVISSAADGQRHTQEGSACLHTEPLKGSMLKSAGTCAVTIQHTSHITQEKVGSVDFLIGKKGHAEIFPLPEPYDKCIFLPIRWCPIDYQA